MKILRITTHWSAEEAEVFINYRMSLKAIWQSYGEDILEMHKIRQLEKQADDEFEDFNNEMPF